MPALLQRICKEYIMIRTQGDIDSFATYGLNLIRLFINANLFEDYSYENEVLRVNPYAGDDEGEFIFKETGLKITWYKHIGRAMEINQILTVSELKIVLLACLNSLKEV